MDESRGPGTDYITLAAEMHTAAEKASDPEIAAEYLALAAKWLRLAEQVQHGPTIDRSTPAIGTRDTPRN